MMLQNQLRQATLMSNTLPPCMGCFVGLEFSLREVSFKKVSLYACLLYTKRKIVPQVVKLSMIFACLFAYVRASTHRRGLITICSQLLASVLEPYTRRCLGGNKQHACIGRERILLRSEVRHFPSALHVRASTRLLCSSFLSGGRRKEGFSIGVSWDSGHWCMFTLSERYKWRHRFLQVPKLVQLSVYFRWRGDLIHFICL